jgi:hypothetical protein
VLFQEQGNTSPVLRFHTLSGELAVTRASSTSTADTTTQVPLYLRMDLPLAEPLAQLPPPLPSLGQGQLGVPLSSEQLEGKALALVHACVGSLPVTEVGR